MADPNWLLSSAAQSAAAVVAIVGGLLATRIVSAAAERRELAARLAEIDYDLESRSEEQNHKEARFLESMEAEYFAEAAKHIADADGNLSFSDLHQLVKPQPPVTLDSLRPHFDRAVTTAKRVAGEIDAVLGRGGPPS